MDRDFVDEHRIYIAVAEACWRGSPAWHVLAWMSYRLSLKYPLIAKRDRVFFDGPIA